MTFAARWLIREDGKIHRCTCGAWVYAQNACSACGPQAPQELAHGVHNDVTLLPKLSTGDVHDPVEIDGGQAHSAPSDQPAERRTA